MIAAGLPLRVLVRVTAPVAFRSRRRIAVMLRGFAATESGSALDMLAAAELTDDARLRRLFFRHAIDEARHARLFNEQARRLDPESRPVTDVRASRQDLFRRLGLVRFLAFLHLAERDGQRHFAALARHFAADPALRALFLEIERDERFHVAYTHKALTRCAGAGSALRRVRLSRAWDVWRRAGRRLGDRLTRCLLAAIYLVVLPPFALLERRLAPERTGWHRPRRAPDSWTALRRQA